MQRILDVRIVRWYFKLAYAAGVWAVGYLVQRLLELLPLPDVALNVLGSAFTLSGILVGARIFRGRDELLMTPRPRWKMTARRPLSWVLGILALLGVVGIVVPPFVGRLSTSAQFANSVITALWYAAIAFLYLNSAVRLGRAAVRPAPIAEPGPYSVTAITQGVVRVLRAYDLPASNDEALPIVRALLTRGSVDRSDIPAALAGEATLAALLRDLNASKGTRQS